MYVQKGERGRPDVDSAAQFGTTGRLLGGEKNDGQVDLTRDRDGEGRRRRKKGAPVHGRRNPRKLSVSLN